MGHKYLKSRSVSVQYIPMKQLMIFVLFFSNLVVQKCGTYSTMSLSLFLCPSDHPRLIVQAFWGPFSVSVCLMGVLILCVYLSCFCIFVLWFSVPYAAAAHIEIFGVNSLRGKLGQLGSPNLQDIFIGG